MSVFFESPYNLVVGDLVVAQASAVNIVGAGEYSEQGTTEARLISTPQAVSKPMLIDETETTITIRWTSQEEGTIYELVADGDNDGQFTKIAELTDTVYTVNKVPELIYYNFKVRAVNVCGSGPYSDELKFEVSITPAAVRAPTTLAEDCSLRIEWTAPDARGAPILAYDVEIQGSDDQFYTEA
jgi:hypothetical protein